MVEVTTTKIVGVFVLTVLGLVLIGFVMQIRELDHKVDEPKDCKTCGRQLDKQIPVAEAFIKLLSATQLPMTGLCNSCKVDIDGSAMRRMGDYCATWKVDERVLDTFDILIPQVKLTCKCNSLLSGVLSPPDDLLQKFPCLKKVPEAMAAVKTSNDLSLEALEICQSMALSFNHTPTRKRARADISISINNFRIRTNALVNKTKHLVHLVVRLAHMTPKDVVVSCNVDPAYKQMCHCLEDVHIPRLVIFFTKAMIPCMLQDTISFQAYNVLRDFAFCYPPKPEHLWKSPSSVF